MPDSTKNQINESPYPIIKPTSKVYISILLIIIGFIFLNLLLLPIWGIAGLVVISTVGLITLIILAIRANFLKLELLDDKIIFIYFTQQKEVLYSDIQTFKTEIVGFGRHRYKRILIVDEENKEYEIRLRNYSSADIKLLSDTITYHNPTAKLTPDTDSTGNKVPDEYYLVAAVAVLYAIFKALEVLNLI
jgi:hypothetical protein